MQSIVPDAEQSRVLIVEDERPLLSYLSTLLARKYEVFTAESTAEAEGIIRDSNVQVVLCDHDMPGEKGLDFLARMRQTQPKTQRILLTGHAETDVFLSAINEGDVLKFLVKPSSIDEIRSAVELGLEEHEKMVESEQFEKENHELHTKLQAVPFLNRRLYSMAQSAWDLCGTTIAATMVGVGIVFMLGIVVLIGLFIFKNAAGIDMLENTRLGQMLPFWQ